MYMLGMKFTECRVSFSFQVTHLTRSKNEQCLYRVTMSLFMTAPIYNCIAKLKIWELQPMLSSKLWVVIRVTWNFSFETLNKVCRCPTACWPQEVIYGTPIIHRTPCIFAMNTCRSPIGRGGEVGRGCHQLQPVQCTGPQWLLRSL